MLMIARLFIDDDGALSYADCDSFLKANRVLYACLNRARFKPAVLSDIATERVLTQLISTVSVRRLMIFLELGVDIETRLQDSTAMTGCTQPSTARAEHPRCCKLLPIRTTTRRQHAY
jgi:hypothetical protein